MVWSQTYPTQIGVEVADRQTGFIDALKDQGRLFGTLDESANAPTDANGWPTTDGVLVVFDNRPFPAWTGSIDDPAQEQPDCSGWYTMSFNGQAQLSSYSGAPVLTFANQTYNSSTNTTTVQVYMPGGPTYADGPALMQINFINTIRTYGGSTNTGVTNVQVIRPGFTLAQANSTQPFDPVFLNSLQPFAYLRFMDWLGTNTNPFYGTGADPTIAWNTRSLPTDEFQGIGVPIRVGAWGVSWEYVILLANAANKDIWINIPVNATGSSDPLDPAYVASPDTSSYVYNLAYLLKNGDAFTGNVGLNSNLHIYIEDSNEVWNDSSAEDWWNTAAAEAEVNMGGSVLNNDGDTNSNDWAARRHIKRMHDIGQIFAGVFGSGSLNNKIRMVYAWWQLDEGTGSGAANALTWFNNNYGAPSNYIYTMAQADYFWAANYNNDTTVDDVLQDLQSGSTGMTDQIQYVQAAYTTTQHWGLQLSTYEGGPNTNDNNSGSTTNMAQEIEANRQYAATDDIGLGMDLLLENQLRDQWFPYGGNTFGIFQLSGDYNRLGNYGLTDDLCDLQLPKYSAVLNLTGYTPPVPAAPSVTAVGATGSVTLSWPSVTAAANYTVERSTTSGGPYTTIYTACVPTYWDTSVSNGTTYYYVVAAVNAVGQQTVSSQVSVTPGALQPPGAPTSLAASPGNAQAILTWSAPTTGGAVSSYQVWDATTGGYTEIASAVSGTSYTATGLTNGSLYYFYVTASNSAGTSGDSNTATVTPSSSIQSQTITFTQPTSPVTDGVSPITLSATASSGLTVTFSILSGPGTVSGNTLTVTGVGTIVIAANQAGNASYEAAPQVTRSVVVNAGSESQTITFTAPTSPVIYPVAPITLQATATSGLTVIFSVISGPGTVSGNILSVTGAGTIVVAANQPGNGVYASAPQVTQSIVVYAGGGPLLAFEPFGEASGTPLSGATGGGDSGWADPWVEQGNETTEPGYEILSTNPLSYSGLQTTSNYAIGGYEYQSSGRQLNVSSGGPFDSYLSSGLIGASGQTIWLSFLIRPDISNGQNEEVLLNSNSNSNSNWSTNVANDIGIGYLGGSAYWGLMYNNGTPVLSSVPVTQGQTALLVTEITFGSTNTINLFVNPTSLGGSAPSTPSATISTTGSVAFQSLAYYGGNGSNQSSLADIRFGASYADVTPAASSGQQSQTITFTAPTSPVTYGVSPITLSASASSGLAVTFSVLSGPGTVSGSTLTVTGAGTIVVAANQAGNSTYSAAPQVTQSVTVNQASQTINFTAPTSPVTYGVSPITLSATATSGLAVTFSVVSGPGTVSGNTLTVTGTGTIVVAANQAGNANYSAASQVTQSVVVNPASGQSQTITFTPPTSPVTYGVSPITLSATASSGLTVTFSVLSGPGTVSGTTLTVTGAGTIVVAANQAGNGTYAAAPQVTQSVVVNQESQTITFTAPTSPVTFGVSPITLSATASSGLAVTFSVTSGPGTISGNTLTVTGGGTIMVAANQAGNANYAAAPQVTQTVVVNPESQTITFTQPTTPVTYGVSPISLSATASSGLAVTFSVSSGPGTISGSTLTVTGVGTIVVAANQAGNANYSEATQVTKSVVVNQASQSITFTQPTSPVPYPTPVQLSATATSGLTVAFSVVSGPGTVSGATLTPTGVGTIVVAANQAGNSDYTAASQVTQSVVVTQATQTINFTAPTSPVTYPVSPITLQATATSGLTVTFSVSSGPGTISGNTLTVTGTGTIVVAANQAGNADYAAATQVTQSVVVNAGGSGTLLAYEPFGETSGSTIALHNASGGGDSGWAEAWYVQNQDTEIPGYNIVDTTPLTYSGLQTTGNYAIGGYNYVSSGRQLNVNSGGPFNSYLSSGLIGASGQTLWLSFLIRADQVNGQTEGVILNSNSGTNAWLTSTGDIGIGDLVGYGGSAYWGLMYNNGTPVVSSVPVTQGQTTLLVAEITFGSTNVINLFVNPTSLGGSAPSTPSATISTTSSIALESLAYYGGNGTGESSIGDIRFGSSYAAVTPTSSGGESQTITFTPPTSPVTYGVSPITLSATATSGLAVTFSVVSGPGTVSGNTLTVTGAGTIVVAANQAGNGTYAAAPQVTQNVVVNQESQSITFTAPSSPVTYGVSPISLSATATSGLAVTFSVVSGPGTVSGSTLTVTGVGTIVVAANQAGNTNYAAASQVTQSVVVNQASQTITFTQPTTPVTYGVSPISLSATASSGLAVTFTVSSGPGTISGSTLTVTGVGTIVVAANQAGNADYTAATQVTKSVVVNQASQTITFTQPTSPVSYPTSPITLSATATSGLTVTFSIVSGPGTVSGNTLTVTGTGTIVIAANQAGNSDYAAATQVTQSVVVNLESQTITFTPPTSPVTYGVSPITLSATASSGLTVTFSVLSGPGTVSGATLTVTGAGTIVVAANQAGNGTYGPAPQVTQSVVVNQESQTITFTQPTTPVTFGVSPISLSATASSGLAVTFTVSSGPGTISGSTLTVTGAGTIVVAANQAGNTNYSAATQVTRSVVVNQESQTITFTQPMTPVTYGVSPLSLSATASSGLAVTFSVVSGPGTVSGSMLTVTGVGTIVVAANQSGNTNYSAASQVTQSVVVNQATQTINFTAPTSPVTYPASPITLQATATSGLTVTFSIVSGPGTVSGATLTVTGTGTIVVAANQAGNADFTAAPQVTESVVVNAGGSGTLLAYEPFGETSGSTIALHNASGGGDSGWGAAWFVQNSDTEIPGYNIVDTNPLTYSGLTTTTNYAIGGYNYVSSGRQLNVTSGGPFNSYLSNGLIGASGQTIWLSFLIRVDNSNGQTNAVILNNNAADNAWLASSNDVGIGYLIGYGGSAYWGLMYNNGTPVLSSVPVTQGQATLLVASITFGSTNVINLYVNPTSLGGSAPSSPSATISTTGSVAFQSLAYMGGYQTNDGSIADIRVGTTYAVVTP
jgi:hypothetical protein